MRLISTNTYSILIRKLFKHTNQINNMFNETLNVTTTIINNSWTYIKIDFVNRAIDILRAPFENYNMLWMLLPLLATAILLEIYFGRYKDEELGWNTAVGNSLVLLFVAIDLFRHTYEQSGLTLHNTLFSGDIKIVISLVIFVFAILLLLVDFFHILPKKIAYAISSPIYINIMGLMGVIIVYSNNIPLDWTTLVACLCIMLIFTGITYLLYFLIPSYKTPLQRILTIEDIDKSYRKDK